MKKIIYIIIAVAIFIGGVMLFLRGGNVPYELENHTEIQTLDENTEQQEQNINEEESVASEEEECYIDETYGICGVEIGLSVEGRSIKAFSVGEGVNTILLIGGVHTGIARNSHDLASALLKHYIVDEEVVPENIKLVVVPSVNPDGIVNNTRTNAHGVDLNRNWPTGDWKEDTYHPQEGTQSGAGGTSALSEPETKALNTYITKLKPDLVIVYYSQAGSVEDNDIGIADTVGALYAEAAGYEHIDEWTYYEVTGDLLASLKEDNVPAVEVVLASREIELTQNIKGVDSVLNHFK